MALELGPSAPRMSRGLPTPPFEAPGAYTAAVDRWGSFTSFAEGLPPESLVVIDRRVARLHPAVPRALRRLGAVRVLGLRAGEPTKSLASLGKVLEAGALLTRSGSLLAVGGGTVGDLCTVAAHLLKRGVK